MEYALPELLTREGMLAILRERQLKVPNMESLPDDELVKVYKTFALPLARRESAHHSRRAIKTTELKADTTIPMELDVPVANANKNSVGGQTKRAYVSVCEKRPHDYHELNPLTDEYLSIATKRIKIAWS